MPTVKAYLMLDPCIGPEEKRVESIGGTPHPTIEGTAKDRSGCDEKKAECA